MTTESRQAPSSDEAHWERLARFFGGESTATEADEVRVWLERNQREAAALGGLDRIVTDAATGAAQRPLDVEAALERSKFLRLGRLPMATLPRARPDIRPRWWDSRLLRAASIIGVVATGALIYRSQETAPPSVVAARVHTGSAGGPDTVLLGDGSRVVLAPNARLEVSEGFGRNGREVSLAGLAFFDVVHDASRPFVVRGGDGEARDLGTAFVVRADSGAPMHVSVRSGVVRVTDAASPSGVTLYAGDRATMGRTPTVVRSAGQAPADDQFAWTSGRLVFRDVPMEDVAREVSRWFGLELRPLGGLASHRIHAEFEGTSREVMVRSLSLALGAVAETKGDTVFLRPMEGAPR